MNNLVGKRVLLRISNNRFYMGGDVQEYKILEVAESGNWVKLININGNKFWKARTDISFVEELKDLNLGKPEL
jgi:hypothetical protein